MLQPQVGVTVINAVVFVRRDQCCESRRGRKLSVEVTNGMSEVMQISF